MELRGQYSWAKHLDFMAVDLAALLLAFFLAYFRKFGVFTLSESWERFVVIITLFNLIIYLAANPYEGIYRRRYYYEIGRSFVAVMANAVCVTILVYILKIGDWYSREVFLTTYLLYFLLTSLLKFLWRKLLHSLSRSGARKRDLFLISTAEKAERDVHSIYSTDLALYAIRGVHLAGAVQQRETLTYKEEGVTETVPVVGEEFEDYILNHNIGHVMVTAPLGEGDRAVYQRMAANGITIHFVVSDLLGLHTEEQIVDSIGVNKVLSVGDFSFSSLQGFYLFLKRITDIFWGLAGTLLLLPVTLAVKLAYLAGGDTAPILYSQQRLGLEGKPFRIWKYRTMVPNAEAALEELLKEERYRLEWEANQKLDKDPRITKIGALLRKTSIDELPQMLNVLRGEMSLVGPRPLVPGELEAHGGLRLYQKVKPGITGWWGCNGRSAIDYRERLDLEYYYVKNCSLYLDVLCILRTIAVVVMGKGAV